MSLSFKVIEFQQLESFKMRVFRRILSCCKDLYYMKKHHETSSKKVGIEIVNLRPTFSL